MTSELALLWFIETRLSFAEKQHLRSRLNNVTNQPPPSFVTLINQASQHIACERVAQLIAAYEAFEANKDTLNFVTKNEISELIQRDLVEQFPPLLTFSGNLEVLKQPKVALIGSRHPTYYGREQCYRFAKALAENGVTVLSGGAIGIDTIANSTGFQFGTSCAVIGGGIHTPYPPSNKGLFTSLSLGDNGLLLSEFSEHAKAERWHFPKRNFTLASLADFVLVIEAGVTSGTLITANAALEFGIDVGALPGPVDSEMSQGTNRLIQNGAFCIQSPDDVLMRLQTLLMVRSKLYSGREHAKDLFC